LARIANPRQRHGVEARIATESRPDGTSSAKPNPRQRHGVEARIAEPRQQRTSFGTDYKSAPAKENKDMVSWILAYSLW